MLRSADSGARDHAINRGIGVVSTLSGSGHRAGTVERRAAPEARADPPAGRLVLAAARDADAPGESARGSSDPRVPARARRDESGVSAAPLPSTLTTRSTRAGCGGIARDAIPPRACSRRSGRECRGPEQRLPLIRRAALGTQGIRQAARGLRGASALPRRRKPGRPGGSARASPGAARRSTVQARGTVPLRTGCSPPMPRLMAWSRAPESAGIAASTPPSRSRRSPPRRS